MPTPTQRRAMGTRRRARRALAALLAASAPALAQPARPGTRVDQGFADIGPSSSSLRRPESDLRQPTGFDTVYRFDRVDAFGNRSQSFVRVDGGLYAVFPRSVYGVTAGGQVVADIPPGTVFHIGAPPELRAPPPAPRPPSETFIRTALPSMMSRPEVPQPVRTGVSTTDDATASPPPEARPPAAPSGTRSIFDDEPYRQRRISGLLREAEGSPPMGGVRPR